MILLVFGIIGGIIADGYLFPYLGSTDFFSKYEFLKKSAENVTIINKTEQVMVKEETSLSKISNQAASSVVNIISHPDEKNPAKNGTGVIVTSDGMVMTYHSAINTNSPKFSVMTHSGNIYDAELEGVDSYSNLAFLKINASNLPAISFGNSDDSKPGEKLISIGNSSELYENEYAAGLLSNLNNFYNISGKALASSEKLEGVFETDFNNQEKFVGGPVVDYSGQTIGIIGSVEKSNGKEYFQIPSNKVKQIIEKALRKELDQNAYFGIYYRSISKTQSLVKGTGPEEGAIIYSPSGQQGLAIIAGSPAQKAGLRIDDVIVAVNGEKITSHKNLPELLYQHKKGNEIELGIWRNGKEQKIKVQL